MKKWLEDASLTSWSYFTTTITPLQIFRFRRKQIFAMSHLGVFDCRSFSFTVNKTRRSTMRPQATFSFFIFLQLFRFFTLLIAPSSSSLLSPHYSCFVVAPSSPCSLLLIAPSSPWLPPLCAFQRHCLCHSESVNFVIT